MMECYGWDFLVPGGVAKVQTDFVLAEVFNDAVSYLPSSRLRQPLLSNVASQGSQT